MTGKLPTGDGEEFLREIITPEGRIVRERLFVNPYTGEVYRVGSISETRYDPRTGSPEHQEQEFLLVLGDGTILEDTREFSICQVGGEPVSRIHSVVDPFCGRILCLMHSQMVDLDGMALRVCEPCAKAIKWQKIKRAILRFFFGKRE